MSRIHSFTAKLKTFFGLAATSIYPDSCVGCDELLEDREEIFCSHCQRAYLEATERECARCFRPRSRCICSRKSLEGAKISRLVKLYTYRSGQVNLPQNRLIYALKHHHRSDVRRFLAQELSAAISAGIGDLSHFVLTFAPRSKSAVIDDGYDHIEELAKEISNILSLPLVFAIKRRKGGKIQKKLSYLDRQKNMKNRFYLDSGVEIKGKSILVLDDIITSGATMMESARVLYENGAKEVVGVVIASTGRDEKRKPRRYSVKYRTMK